MPQVDYRAWLKKRTEYPDSIFMMKTELMALASPANQVLESEAVRFLHLEKVDSDIRLSPMGALAVNVVAQAAVAL